MAERTLGTMYFVDPRYKNTLIDEKKINVVSRFAPYETTKAKVDTHMLETTISGPSCQSCCDNCGDDKTSTHRYSRVTLGNVFNQLRKDDALPDESKILNLWYINRYKGCKEDEIESDENSDDWWFQYIIDHYKSVNFVHCTLFDEKTDYSLY